MKTITQRAYLELKLCTFLLLSTTLALGFLSAHAQEGAIYKDLKPDQFLKSWLVLKSIPVPHESGRSPDEPAQKKSFAQDWLADSGGETRIEPKPGMKVKIGDRVLEWQVVDYKSDIVDLRRGADLDAVVGKYDYGQGKAVLTVTRESDHVFAQLTGQPKFEIFPKSPTEFFWKTVNAQVTFV